jgi:hypothetical protein
MMFLSVFFSAGHTGAGYLGDFTISGEGGFRVGPCTDLVGYQFSHTVVLQIRAYGFSLAHRVNDVNCFSRFRLQEGSDS